MGVTSFGEKLHAALAKDHATRSTLKILFMPATKPGRDCATKPLIANEVNNINFLKKEHTYGHRTNNNLMCWLRHNCCTK